MITAMQLHQWAVAHKQQIITFFHICEISLIVFTVTASTWAMLHPEFLSTLYLIGPKFGEAGAILLSITLLPGIIGRFKLFPIPRATMMMFRRQLGISTYLLIATHSLFMYFLVSFTYGFTALTTLELYGVLALTCGTPLIITSNDYSQRLLQKWWDRLHKLVYLMLIFGLLHTMLFEVGLISLMLGAVVVLELASFLVQYVHDHAVPRG